MEAINSKKEKSKKVTRKSRQRYNKRIYHNLYHNIINCIKNNCITCAKSFVANLSGKDLTDPQILLLSKGLSFVPTARDASHFELIRDFDTFCHKIRRLSLRGHNKTKVKKFPLKRTQKYSSKQVFFSFPSLEGVLEAMKVEISQIPITDNLPHNLSPSERKALRELKCNKDLIINKADKGSTIVVQNKADYILDALQHLNDPNTYRVLDGDPTSNICHDISVLLQDFLNKGLLDKEMVALCTPPKKVCPARLYFLKKIHKSPMGIQPIVSSCESPTENLSQFIDHWLQPLMKALPSYIKDTTQLINELKELTVEPNTLLVTVDVKSLYTCMPHSDGVEACIEALCSSTENHPQRPNTAILSCLLEVVLKNNIFEFDGKFYKQLQGTAMGTKLAPAYANLFMGKLENAILSHAPLKPSFYRRYIDDILILWPHSENDLKEFLLRLNSVHPTIKFTWEYDKNRITFLDVDIYKGPNFPITNKFDVETHIKPTNKQAYIHAQSHHPRGASKGVAMGEMKRYLRTNSLIETFYKFKTKHELNLKKRGYSREFINLHTSKVKFLDRSIELKPRNKRPMNRISFVTRYSPSASRAIKIIKKYWPSLEQLKYFNNTLPPSPMLAYKANRNIKSFLVRAKLPSLDCNIETHPPSSLPLEYTPIATETTAED